jgi:hypothetical protein
MRGEILRLQFYDLGGTLDLVELERRMAGRHPGRRPAIGKGTPGYVRFPEPLVLELAPLGVRGSLGSSSCRVFLSYLAIGAAYVRLRVPFEVVDLSGLARAGELRFEVDGQWLGAEEACRRLLERERAAWESAIRERYTRDILDESYTVFACHDVGEAADQFFSRNRRQIAALLKGEDGARLHEKEIEEGTRTWFSYYSDDVVVVDWDSAFLIDPSPEYEDLVFVLEIANLQLLEFRAYDRYLDGVLARGYDELERVYRKSFFSTARKTAHDLSLLRMEIAELADEADNITKFLGDWFLARVYEAAQERFHLAAWRATVDEKLATLHQLYQIAVGESDNRRLLVLEVLIVLLFVLDVGLLLLL